MTRTKSAGSRSSIAARACFILLSHDAHDAAQPALRGRLLAWTRQQANQLRRLAKTRPNLPLDLEHIAEEIRDLGKSEHGAAFSLAQRVIERLLLIEHSPAADERLHWADEVDGFRDQLKRKLSPTIRRHLRRDLGQVFADGRRLVERKLRRHGEERAAGARPESCPYTLEQVLGDSLPEVELRSE